MRLLHHKQTPYQLALDDVSVLARRHKKKKTGTLKLFLSTSEGFMAKVKAAISAVLQMTEPMAFP